MNAPTQQLNEPLPAPPAGPVSGQYDAFLSYTHEDRPVAKAIQDALHRIGRRFGQRRALRVFRDDTNLEVSQDLWGKITEAMHDARFMVVVLSPLAAKSHWVNAEVEHWLALRNGPRPMFVLAGGRLDWDRASKCFNPLTSDAAPPVLTVPGVVPVEPFFLDVSRDGPPWSASSAGFRDKMTALAAPMHGKPKDQLAGDDLREYRKLRRVRAAAVAALALLTVVAIVLGGTAFVQRRAAVDQRNEAVAARLTAEARSMLDDSGSGNDVLALQQILAARTIGKHPDDGALYNAVVAKANVLKMFDTGAPNYGGAASPDGKRIVTGSADKTVHIWDCETGQPVGPPLEGHQDMVSGVAWSPDGLTIATSSADKTIRLWDAVTGKPMGDPGTDHQGVVMAVAFSPDSKLVASASQDATVRIWEVHDDGPHAVVTLKGHYGEVRAVAFSPNGTRLASVGADATVHLWDVATARPIDTKFAVQFNPLFGVAWAADNQTLATSGWDGVIRLWNADTGEQIGTLEGHRAPVINAVFVGDGRFLLSGSFDKTVRMWDVANRTQIGDPLTGTDGGVAVSVVTAGHLAAVSNDHTIRLLDIAVGQPLTDQAGFVSAVAFSPDRDQFATGSWNGNVVLWEAGTNRFVKAIGPSQYAATTVAYGPEGRLIVARTDASIEVWDIDDGEGTVMRTLRPCWPMGGVAISPDGEQVAVSCTDQKMVQLWRPDDSEYSDPVEIPDPRGPVGPIAFSPDGSRLATGSGKTIQLWDVETQDPIGSAMSGHADFVSALNFGPDNNRLISAAGDNTIRLWDVATGRSLSETPPEGNAIMSIDFSGDNEHVVSGNIDGDVRVWTVAGDEIRPLGIPMTRHSGMVAAIGFSKDGKKVISGSADNTLRSWPVEFSTEDLCKKLAVNMTPDEWAKRVSPDIEYRRPCP